MPNRKSTQKTTPDLTLVGAETTNVGVHLNLPEKQYFAQDALGSSDLKILLRDPASWWYASAHNPQRPERATRSQKEADAREIGSALHTLLFEGVDAYQEQFAVEPDETIERQTVVKSVDIRRMLEENGVDPGREYKFGPLITMAKRKGLGHRIYQVHRARFEARVRDGLVPIKASLDFRLRHMAALVENHPDLGPGLRQGLSEVSVFWDRETPTGTVRMRARLDKLAPAWTLDLKTLGNWRGRDPRSAAIAEIREREYDIQRRLYDEARARIRDFVNAGNVYAWAHNGVPVKPLAAEMRCLEAVAAESSWRWVWLFYQVRIDDADSSKARAPVVVPFFHEPAGAVWDQAGEKVERALSNFADLKSRNGLTEPWAQIDPITEITDSDLASLQYKGLPR